MGPIGHRPQRRAGRKVVAGGEQSHQGDEPAVGAAVQADALRVDAVLVHQVLGTVDLVLQILPAHVLVNRGAPVTTVAGRAPVIDIEHRGAALHQQMVESSQVPVRS